MPLACLSKIQVPEIYFEVIDLHDRYFESEPFTSDRYVAAMVDFPTLNALKKIEDLTGLPEYIVSRLNSKDFTPSSDIYKDFFSQDRRNVANCFWRLLKAGRVERRGDRGKYEYRLID